MDRTTRSDRTGASETCVWLHDRPPKKWKRSLKIVDFNQTNNVPVGSRRIFWRKKKIKKATLGFSLTTEPVNEPISTVAVCKAVIEVEGGWVWEVPADRTNSDNLKPMPNPLGSTSFGGKSSCKFCSSTADWLRGQIGQRIQRASASPWRKNRWPPDAPQTSLQPLRHRWHPRNRRDPQRGKRRGIGPVGLWWDKIGSSTPGLIEYLYN